VRLTKNIAANHSKVWAEPSLAASGPAKIKPSGAKTRDPKASYEDTRDNESGGIFFCMEVCHKTKKNSMAIPAQKAEIHMRETTWEKDITKSQMPNAT
jgi:hypothetical protein